MGWTLVVLLGLIGLLMLAFSAFLWVYPRLLRWVLAHKLAFLSLPLFILLVLSALVHVLAVHMY